MSSAFSLYVSLPVQRWLARRREVTPGAKLVYALLSELSDEGSIVRVSKETIALETGMPPNDVEAALLRLELVSLIAPQEGGGWMLLDHPWSDATFDDDSGCLVADEEAVDGR